MRRGPAGGALMLLAALAAAPLAADPHANVAGGFSPEKAFQIGDVDHVNLFNGNVVITIPIGLSYPVGGGFSHGLSLVHNANPWFFTQRSDQTTGQTYTQGAPTPCSNAGLGWRVSLGEIDPPCASVDVAGPTYEDASGADHVFYPTLHAGEAVDTSAAQSMYTHDGTYLRLQTVGADYELDFHDGSIHHFHHLASDTASPLRQRLLWMKDAFGNRVDVDYSVAGQWTITDTPAGAAAARTHHIYLRSDLPGYAEMVSEIDLAGLGPYRFAYTTATIARACPSNDFAMGYGVTVPFLVGVTLPDGSTYSMAASDYSMPAPPQPYPQNTQTTCVTGAGDVLGLQLPTLGRIEWSYMTYKFPAANTPWRTKTQGVATRTTRNEQGTILGQWTYATSLSADNRELLNSVTNPLGQRTDHYFSVALDNSLSGWSWCDYAQPFTRNVSTGGTGPLYLSTRTFRTNGTAFRTEYLRYERDQAGVCDAGTSSLDYRVAKARTVYDDDGGVYAETDSSSFDGLGHYRVAQTAGTFPTGNVRAHLTNYNPTRGAYNVDPDANTVSGGFVPLAPTETWLLGTSNYQWDAENGVTGSFVETCFDGTTGFLRKKRVHVATGSAASATDAVAEYVPDGQGNLSAEKSYGGDVQAGVGTGNVCGYSPGAGLPASPEYEVDYGYQYGVRASARYLGAPFYSLNQQIDPATGLASSSTDSAGLTTTFTYDAMGRPAVVQPAQGAKTVYAYTPADPTTRALAGVDVQRQAPGGTVLARQQLVFDALGRLWHETQKLAVGSFNVRETLYDGAGNKASVSELQAGNAVQKTSFLFYDPAGRATLIRPADSTAASNFAHDVSIAYSGARSVARTVRIGQTLASGAVVESPATTTETYDRQGRLYQVTEPSGAAGAAVTTTYGYDVGNRLSSVATTGSGVTQTRSFTYDQRGFLLAESHPEKVGAVSYSLYDSRGHARRKVDGANDLTYQYDFAERLTLVRQTGAGFTACNQLSGPLCYKLWSYAVQNGTNDWKNGKLFQSVRYNYPVLGGTQYQAFITETYHYGGVDGRVSQRDAQLTFALYGQPPQPSESFTQTFAYDLLGDTTSLGYPQCTFAACTQAGAALPRTVSLGYTNGFLTSVTGLQGTTASTYASAIAYWPNLTVAQVVHGNGVTDTQANDPNAMRRPLSIAAAINNGATTLWKTDGYLYDGAGNVTQIGAARFLYDPVSRLASGSLVLSPQDAGAAVSQTYAYDAFGNIQSIGGTVARATPTSSATNRLNGAGTTYDAAGNLTAWNGATYEYDALDQLKHYVSGSEEWLYIYDADDERLWSYKPGVPGFSVRFDRWTLRDLAGKVLRTYEASGYNWTGSVAEDDVYRDGLLLAAELPNATDTPHHLHLDHLGTPRLITNRFGAQLAYHAYYPFGEEATAFNQDAERMKLTGHERDLASPAGAGDDLDYMHARHCSPVTGRFLSVDAVQGTPSQPQAWNRYTYAFNSPLRFLDSDGRDGLTFSDIAGAAYEATSQTADQLAFATAYPVLKVASGILNDSPGEVAAGAGMMAAEAAAGALAEVATAGRAGAAAQTLFSDASKSEVLAAVRGGGELPGKQAEAVLRQVQRATTKEAVTVTRDADGTVKVLRSRPGANGRQVIETTISRSGRSSTVQKAYDALGNLVHYDPKTKLSWWQRVFR